jgi:hypothetical protein
MFVIWHVTGAGVNTMFTESWLNAGLDGRDFVCGIHQKLGRNNNIGRLIALCNLRGKCWMVKNIKVPFLWKYY